MASKSDEDIPTPPGNFDGTANNEADEQDTRSPDLDMKDDLTEEQFKSVRRMMNKQYNTLLRVVNKSLSDCRIPPHQLEYIIEEMGTSKCNYHYRLRELKGLEAMDKELPLFRRELLKKSNKELKELKGIMRARELLFLRRLTRNMMLRFERWENECKHRWATLKVAQFLDAEAVKLFGDDLSTSLFAQCFFPSVALDEDGELDFMKATKGQGFGDRVWHGGQQEVKKGCEEQKGQHDTKP